MQSVQKKVKYIVQILPLIKVVENWWEIILTYFFSGKSHLLRLKNGAFFVIQHHIDALAVKEDFIDNEYDIKLNNPKVIIDIGAHIGTTSVFFSKKYSAAKIYSYEPAKSTYNLLIINLLLNGANNVIAENYGITGKTGVRSFYTHPASGLSSISKKRSKVRKETIKTLSLDEVFIRHKIKRCDLLKVDSEGSEYEMFFNVLKSTIAKTETVVLEYHDGLTKYSHVDLIRYLKDMGYKTKIKKHSIEDDRGIIYAKR